MFLMTPLQSLSKIPSAVMLAATKEVFLNTSRRGYPPAPGGGDPCWVKEGERKGTPPSWLLSRTDERHMWNHEHKTALS
jgi:hypothetical protein